MPYSARALGGGELRLRSHRVRADRSRRVSLWLVLAVVLLASLIGALRASVIDASAIPIFGAPSGLPPAAPANLEEQRYLDALWPIHSQLEHSVARMGLLAAFYKSRDIDRAEFRARLNEGLATYALAEAQVSALDPPPVMRKIHAGYLTAVHLFQQSALEMLEMYDDDGDEAHFSAAVPLCLEGTTRMRELSEFAVSLRSRPW